MIYPNPQIYHSLRAIFVHVPKTGGTAIERTLLQGANVPMGGHTTAAGFRHKYPDCFEDYFKFAVVRDPLARFLSAYRYLRQQPIHPALNNSVIHEAGTLEGFVNIVSADHSVLQTMVHLLPQTSFVCDMAGEILVDDVFEYSNLQAAWQRVCEKLNLPQTVLPLVNASRKADATPLPVKLPGLVRDIYREDYRIFGFSGGVGR